MKRQNPSDKKISQFVQELERHVHYFKDLLRQMGDTDNPQREIVAKKIKQLQRRLDSIKNNASGLGLKEIEATAQMSSDAVGGEGTTESDGGPNPESIKRELESFVSIVSQQERILKSYGKKQQRSIREEKKLI